MDRLIAILAHLCGDDQVSLAADECAARVVSEIKSAEKPGHHLQHTVDELVSQAGGWSESLARTILHLLEAVLRAGAPMRLAMRDAYNKSADAAEKLTTFAKDHPVLCTVVALGVLAILMPMVITMLGFTVEGVVEGSFAAAWQSTYGGFVEAGSWFAYFQKLGTMMG